MPIKIDGNKPSYEELPSVFAINLDSFSAIKLVGEEQNKYLQGQVTCDVNSLEEHSLLNGAHCDAKGKLFSLFRLIARENAFLLMQPQSSIDASFAELTKFGVFAKVDISVASELSFYAVAGNDAHEKLKQHFSQIPDNLSPVVTEKGTTLVYIAGKIDRYLIIDSPANIEKFSLSLNITTYTYDIWKLLEITDGFAQVEQSAVSEYVPQMLNAQAINAISFTKGCYLGQETVARMQYLGKNKKALFLLSGSQVQCLGNNRIIEKQLGENWRKAGDVLASYQADNGETYIQAVLANDIEPATPLRLKTDAAPLTINALPYTLN